MLDLRNLPTSAVMRLVKAAPRRDGAGIVWDYDLSVDVPDAQAAEMVDTYVPGAARAFASGDDGARGKASTSGGFDLCALELAAEDGRHLARGHAEVRQATVSVTAAQAVLVVRLRVHGLLERAATDVVYQLDEVLQVRLTTQQAGRISVADAVGAGSSRTQRGSQPGGALTGRLVVVQQGDELVAGVVTSQHGDTLQLEALGDHPVVVELGSTRPATVLDVVPPAGEALGDLVLDYTERCDDAGVRASWHDVITAIGVLYAQQRLQALPDYSWELVPEVWDTALEHATRRADAITAEA
jgi:hypothetical protein